MRKHYEFAYDLVKPLCALLYPRRKHVCPALPDGPAIYCANHSNYIDPVLLGLAVGKKHWLHFMAKAELSASKLFGALLKKLGVIFVRRGENDIGAIRSTMGLLKEGEQVCIFPEGTRVSEPDAIAAKEGAVRIAMRLGVPIIPAFITRNKRIFRKVDVVVGDPFYISSDADPQEQTDKLMRRIESLDPGRDAYA